MCQAFEGEFHFVLYLERERDSKIKGKCLCGCSSYDHNPAWPDYPCRKHRACRAFKAEYVSTVGDIA